LKLCFQLQTNIAFHPQLRAAYRTIHCRTHHTVGYYGNRHMQHYLSWSHNLLLTFGRLLRVDWAALQDF